MSHDITSISVSYTHLDVYKRQVLYEIYQNMKKEKRRYEKTQLENAIYDATAEASDLFIC